MLRQALLAAVAISYLICVLVMSGMQKEDLDVSLLRKLQRYNVNIGDMDNEKIRRQCSTRKEGLTGFNKSKNDVIFISTTERTTTTSAGDTFKRLEIEGILNYLQSQKETLLKFNQTTTEKYVYVEKKVTSENEYFEDRPKIDMNSLQRYFQLYATNQSNAVNNNTSIENLYSQNLKDVELIGGVFNDNIIPKETPITTEHATTADPIINNIYKQINDLIATVSKANIKTGNVSKINNKSKDTTTSRFKETQTEQIFDKVNPQIKGFYDFINVMNQFRTYSSILLGQNMTPVFSNLYRMELEPPMLSTVNPMKNIKYEEFTTNEPENKRELKQKNLSPNLVQEIADSVKEVIITDLRKELSDIYITTTQSTTVTTSTASITTEAPTTNINGIDLKGKTIIEAFMELCNKMKAFKQTTFVSEEQKKLEEPGFNIRQNLKMPPLLPIGKSPQVDSIFLPIFDKYNNKQTAFSSDDHYNRNQFVNINSYHPRQIKRHQSPITIQTNSVEIKPLVVPVNKPESLIRQNIIVSRKDIFHSREDHLEAIIPKQNAYLDVRANRFNSKLQRNPYSTPLKLYGYQDSGDREDVIKFRIRNNGNSKFDTDYYEKINFDNRNIEQNRGVGYDHVIPRLHKRWERLNDRIPAFYNNDNIGKNNRYQGMPNEDGTRKPAIDDIPSRNQMSLIDMKKGSSFDDTHFKNFLKSQQKVTDILERILANKPQTNTPPVVEIT